MRSRRYAGAREREVVGLYGDPDTTWGIGLEAHLDASVDAARARDGLRRLLRLHPHLGTDASVEETAPGGEGGDVTGEELRRRTLGEPFRPGRPLVRAALLPSSEGGTRLVVAAHHGVCDGLGLLALVDAATGVPVLPTAAGVGNRRSGRSFAVQAPGRVLEAFRRPPPRFPALLPPGPVGETLATRTLPRFPVGTVALCHALAAEHASRQERASPRSSAGRRRSGSAVDHRPLLFVGASRRPPRTVAPDRQTAYLRLRVDPQLDLDRLAEEFRGLAPEPDFPETSLGGIGPWVTRRLRRRLGSTAVVSNLGVLEGAVREVAMYPALSGPVAVAVGMASTSRTTTVSLRTRSHEISTEDAAALLDSVLVRLRRAQ